jgi:serine/threonine protein kinase
VKDDVLKMRIAFDICCGMAYLHSQRLAHRDLRSPNVLLTSLNPKDKVGVAVCAVVAVGVGGWVGVW